MHSLKITSLAFFCIFSTFTESALALQAQKRRAIPAADRADLQYLHDGVSTAQRLKLLGDLGTAVLFIGGVLSFTPGYFTETCCYKENASCCEKGTNECFTSGTDCPVCPSNHDISCETGIIAHKHTYTSSTLHNLSLWFVRYGFYACVIGNVGSILKSAQLRRIDRQLLRR